MDTGISLSIGTESIAAIAQHCMEEAAIHHEVQGGDVDVAKSGIELFGQVKKDSEDLQHEIEAIAVNPDLSGEGKKKEAISLVGKRYSGFGYVALNAKYRREAYDELKARLMAVPKPQGNETTEFLIGSEIRQRLARLPLHERMKTVVTAVRDGHQQVLRAIETDPMGESLVEASYLLRLKEERAQETQGKAWTKLKTLEFIGDRLTTLATAIDLSLKNYGVMPTFPSQPTKTLDLKMENTQQAPKK